MPGGCALDQGFFTEVQVSICLQAKQILTSARCSCAHARVHVSQIQAKKISLQDKYFSNRSVQLNFNWAMLYQFKLVGSSRGLCYKSDENTIWLRRFWTKVNNHGSCCANHLDKPVIIAKLMLINLFYLYNRTRLVSI